ncbi:hypothetical protein GCM10009665_37740 [Kitasatospora nipponensis]|uniref:Uncharacterized protein n=1 Tax=Kitasatospora nipponensis TaxID=258049 RepID=A0ABN1WEH3_9ACTN
MAAFPMTPEDRLQKLRATLSGGRAETPAGRRLRLNRPGNVLVGALLHGADRMEKGLELTDLEQRLIDLVGDFVPVEELGEFGRVYREAAARGPITILPERITSLPLETGYSLADLKADLPAITAQVMAQPNVRVVDVSALREGEPLDDEEFVAALAEYGRGATFLKGSASGDGVAAADDIQGQVRMHAFTCERRSNELGKDEIYWGIASGSDRQAKTSYNTREYGSTVAGTRHVFDANTFVFNGTLNQHITCEIQCWEADASPGGFYTELRKALARWAEAALDLSVTLTKSDSDTAAGWAAWFAIGAGLLNLILGWLINDDDLVCERSFAFNRAALRDLAGRPQGDTWLFDGGSQGRHRLELRWTGADPGVGNDRALTMNADGRVAGDIFGGGADQSLRLVSQVDGSTGIRGAYNNVVLTITPAGALTARSYTGGQDQSFTLVAQADGSTGIRGKYYNFALTMDANGNVTGHPYNGSPDQSFILVTQADGSTGIRGKYHAAG